MKFVVQFVNLGPGLVQCLLAGSCDLVDPATVPSNISEDGLQKTTAFQSMQKRVESSRSNAISVMRQFLHHCKTEDGLVGRMYEYMNPYQAEIEFSLVTGHRIKYTSVQPESNLDSVISNFDNNPTLDL